MSNTPYHRAVISSTNCPRCPAKQGEECMRVNSDEDLIRRADPHQARLVLFRKNSGVKYRDAKMKEKSTNGPD